MPTTNSTHPRHVMRLQAVMAAVGFGRAHIYNLMAVGKFPRSRRIGTRAVGWDSQEIEAWVAAQLEG
ncbi:Prophage CP4-57 regulatory protein (AlpA) [compost metagenome]